MKTAVEWLVEEINKLTGLTIQMDEPIIEQAKEMEKEQIIDAYYYDPNCDEIKDDGEQYYKETYEQD
jgi:hypothetical protein